MKEASTLRTIRLTSYLIEQGAYSDPSAYAAIFAKIHTGVLPAFITVFYPDHPPGASFRGIYRYAQAEKREISVRDRPSVNYEVMKAALGRDANMAVLDTISVRVPDETPTPKAVVKPMAREEAHKLNILNAIQDLGYTPKLLPPTPKGKSGVKLEVWNHLRGSGISRSAFDKAWQSLREEKSIG